MRKTILLLTIFFGVLFFAQSETTNPKSSQKNKENSKTEKDNEKLTNAAKLEDKLGKIIIPHIEFEETDIETVISFLVRQSAELSQDKNQVNIILMIPREEKKRTNITLNLNNIPLLEAIKYVAISAGLQYKVEDYAVVLTKPFKK